MAARTLESRFERMSVLDDNDAGDGSRLYPKLKVRERRWLEPSRRG